MNPERVPTDLLIDRGYITTAPTNNARYWDYGNGDNCDHYIELPINESHLMCPICAADSQMSLLRKCFSPPVVRHSMPEHFNMALGKHVSNPAQIRSEYSRINDRESARLGFDTNFQPVDLRESPAEMSVTDKGLEDTFRKHRELGAIDGKVITPKKQRDIERLLP